MTATNPYCEALGIRVPSLSDVADHPHASTYSLLIVCLLERGAPMTLVDVADRFQAANVMWAEVALRSLQRCRPARAPVYRDGEHYALDPYDDETDLWAFRLGLRPARGSPVRLVPRPAKPLPADDEPIGVEELDEIWAHTALYGNWSSQRIALCVLDAHRRPMLPADVVAFVAARATYGSFLRVDEPQFGRRRSAITVLDDGRWTIAPGHPSLESARRAVRERLVTLRTQGPVPDAATIRANSLAADRRKAAHAAELALLRRAIVCVFPTTAPQAAVIVDVAERQLETLVGDELGTIAAKLHAYDVVGAVDVRTMLRALGVETGARRLDELGPPQKTMQLNKRGRTLRITLDMLVRGSCGISRPFGDPKVMANYLREGHMTRLRRRLEADAKSLHALYQYGRLHGVVRLQCGFLDEMLPVSWLHRDERGFWGDVIDADKAGTWLEVVVGSAPGWSDPWARAMLVRPVMDDGWPSYLIDQFGVPVELHDVQLARKAR